MHFTSMIFTIQHNIFSQNRLYAYHSLLLLLQFQEEC